ncbi:MAG: hypothetical protein DMF67_17325 [Acidobacteria bacterium]|nr:MAG: hypothetical protein DMF67_17325 [Acidobacteriota bacterium]
MAAQRLQDAHKQFIVQALACFMTPSEVAEAVKLESRAPRPCRRVLQRSLPVFSGDFGPHS